MAGTQASANGRVRHLVAVASVLVAASTPFNLLLLLLCRGMTGDSTSREYSVGEILSGGVVNVCLFLALCGISKVATDCHDENWLRVTAHCGASGASVWAQGAILMVTDVAGFGDGCTAMLGGKSKTAALTPLEPDLKVTLESTDSLGHVRAHVEITPVHVWQSHRFEFEVDQSYLPGIIKQCSDIVSEYPSRGTRG